MLQARIDKIDRWRYQQVAAYCLGATLDIACGLKGLREFIPQGSYRGCDLMGGDIHCSAYQLPFKDRSFQTTVLGEALEHMGMPLLALEEAARVCRQRIIITVPNNYSLVKLSRLLMGRREDIEPEHVLSFNSCNLERLLDQVGFAVVEHFCFPLRLQCFPELPVKSRFGYWLFVVADRRAIAAEGQ